MHNRVNQLKLLYIHPYHATITNLKCFYICIGMEDYLVCRIQRDNTIVVHSRDNEGVGADHKVNFPKPPHSLDDDGAVLFWFKQAFRLTRNAFKNLLQNFRNFVFNGIFYWPTAWCLQSMMAKVTGLIYLFIFAVRCHASGAFWHATVYIMILHRLTSALLCVPFIFPYSEKCQFCGRHMMASIHKGHL